MLVDYLVTSNTRKQLFKVLFGGLNGSVHDLARLANASYAATYEELKAMKGVELVNESRKGKARVFSLNYESKDLPLLRALFGLEELEPPQREEKDLDETKATLARFGAPLNFEREAKLELELEDTLALGVYFSQQEASLLRVLPLVVERNMERLDFDKLWHFALKYHVKRQVGFLLDLTGTLTKKRSYKDRAKEYWDNRYGRPTSYFKMKTKSPSQLKLEELNTPPLAKKWFFTMNMGMDSFKSFYEKFKAS